MPFQVVRADGLVDGRAAVQVVDDELPERLLLLGDDADTALAAVVEDEIIQNDSVEIGAENAQHHRLFVVDEGGGKRHAHARQSHGAPQIHAQVFVQDFGHDVQPARGRVAVEEDAQADAHRQHIAQHVQLLTVRHGGEIRKQRLEKPEEQGQHDAGVHGLDPEFPAAGEKADDQQRDVQDHRDRRQRKRHKIGQHDSKAGDAAHGRVAGRQKKEHRRRDDCHRPGQH